MICSSTARKRLHPSAAAAVILMSAGATFAEVRVVTTTPTLADITRQIGGEHVTVESVMRGPENAHNVQAKPSHMIKLKRADLFIHSGLDAELWAPLLVKGARNRKLLPGRPGNVDVSRGITLKEVPQRGGLTRALGDIHVYGNTHYVLDPLNGVIIGRTIADALKRADSGHADEFEQRYQDFAKRTRELTDRLVVKMSPYRGVKVVTYHRTWPYLLDRFGLIKIGEVESKPGISPGPRHLAECVENMKAQGAKIVIVETFNSRKNAETVAERAAGAAVVLAQNVNALDGVDSYEKVFEHNIEALVDAFQKAGVEPAAAESP